MEGRQRPGLRIGSGGVFADAGGVHMNSGIPNRAAYLLSEGMSLPNGGAPRRFQPGIGLDRMMQLKFASMRFLPANASFAAARNFEVQYATTLARLPFTGFGAAEVAAPLKVSVQTADSGPESGMYFVTIPANTWTKVTATRAQLGNPSVYRRVNVQIYQAAPITVSFDEIRLLP